MICSALLSPGDYSRSSATPLAANRPNSSIYASVCQLPQMRFLERLNWWLDGGTRRSFSSRGRATAWKTTRPESMWEWMALSHHLTTWFSQTLASFGMSNSFKSTEPPSIASTFFAYCTELFCIFPSDGWQRLSVPSVWPWQLNASWFSRPARLNYSVQICLSSLIFSCL